MFKINVINSEGSVINAYIGTQEEIYAWYNFHYSKGVFGRITEYSTRQVKVSDEVQDQDGNILSPAIFMPEQYISYQETFTHEVTPYNEEAQKLSNESRDFLNSTDYKVLRHIREKALQLPTTLSEQQYLELEQQRHEAAANIIDV